ncbi:MAG: DUF1684 domain-containing protein [Pseudomonadota bacterium]
MKQIFPALLMASLGVIAACGDSQADVQRAAHAQEVMEWREWRLEQLLKPTGFLTQVGLYWIGDGRYSIGSAAGSDIRLPATAAAHVGDIALTDQGPLLTVADGVDVVTAADDGSPLAVTELLMLPDSSGEIVMATLGSIAWSVVERGGKLAVRVRDFEHPWVDTFGPLPYYEINPKWRVDATLHRYDEPRVITVNTVIEGFQQNPTSPGVVRFEVDGAEYELEPQLVGERLFFVFGDQTNRGETYGAGRYLYAEVEPDSDQVVLDFNKSYSPPCAFNDFSTCPIASPRNRLDVRIDAGEKYDEGLHYAGES